MRKGRHSKPGPDKLLAGDFPCGAMNKHEDTWYFDNTDKYIGRLLNLTNSINNKILPFKLNKTLNIHQLSIL